MTPTKDDFKRAEAASRKIDRFVLDLIVKAVMQERQRCAAIVEKHVDGH